MSAALRDGEVGYTLISSHYSVPDRVGWRGGSGRHFLQEKETSHRLGQLLWGLEADRFEGYCAGEERNMLSSNRVQERAG